MSVNSSHSRSTWGPVRGKRRRPGSFNAVALIAVLLTILVTVSACAPLLKPSPRAGMGCVRQVQLYRLGAFFERILIGRVLASPHSSLPFEVSRRLHIVIDTPSRRLTLYLGNQVLKTYPVAVGKAETPTPIGHWEVMEKDVWGGGFGVRWMGLSVPWGTYGIHGTNKPWSVGTRASGGCVRMQNRDVTELYDLVPRGIPVTIRGPAFSRYGEVRRTIRRSHIGSDVLMLQQRLQQLGLYNGPLDGIFGRGTEQGVRAFQQSQGLPVTGEVGPQTYELLGIVPGEEDPSLKPEK